MIRTKIVATMGPACNDVGLLHQLFDAGVDVCRLNFSHGKLEDHGRMLLNIREAASKYAQPIAVLGDLGGPKIRLGQVKDTDGSGGMKGRVGEEPKSEIRCPRCGARHRITREALEAFVARPEGAPGEWR